MIKLIAQLLFNMAWLTMVNHLHSRRRQWRHNLISHFHIYSFLLILCLYNYTSKLILGSLHFWLSFLLQFLGLYSVNRLLCKPRIKVKCSNLNLGKLVTMFYLFFPSTESRFSIFAEHFIHSKLKSAVGHNWTSGSWKGWLHISVIIQSKKEATVK